jgi:hypothetical protein
MRESLVYIWIGSVLKAMNVVLIPYYVNEDLPINTHASLLSWTSVHFEFHKFNILTSG